MFQGTAAYSQLGVAIRTINQFVNLQEVSAHILQITRAEIATCISQSYSAYTVYCNVSECGGTTLHYIDL